MPKGPPHIHVKNPEIAKIKKGVKELVIPGAKSKFREFVAPSILMKSGPGLFDYSVSPHYQYRHEKTQALQHGLRELRHATSGIRDIYSSTVGSFPRLLYSAGKRIPTLFSAQQKSNLNKYGIRNITEYEKTLEDLEKAAKDLKTHKTEADAKKLSGTTNEAEKPELEKILHYIQEKENLIKATKKKYEMKLNRGKLSKEIIGEFGSAKNNVNNAANFTRLKTKFNAIKTNRTKKNTNTILPPSNSIY